MITEPVELERRAVEGIVLGAFGALTGRRSEPLRYAMMDDTPVGVLGLARGERGLRRLSYVRDEDEFLRRLLEENGDAPVLRSETLDDVRRALDRYFSGKRLEFDLPVDLAGLPPFQRRVLAATARILPGRVATYSEIASRAGSARASRAAGNALHVNPVAIVVPCHRVVRADGSLGGYGGGVRIKEWLLAHEGARPAAL
ncbi:MAG TPA: methylated-DNA--[protein]-cysteine S-methyltransferase [Gemmatimonadales bacterium]|nr:methylated-DNA--[protein]-cysteine S-methyltransferase [Gemmatimonadales bacterium]